MSAVNVEVYNPDTFEYEPSEREYVVVGEIVNEVQEGWGSGFTRKHTTVYLDESTGILVGDIRAYEAWVRS